MVETGRSERFVAHLDEGSRILEVSVFRVEGWQARAKARRAVWPSAPDGLRPGLTR